jgi:hypothetical protein
VVDLRVVAGDGGFACRCECAGECGDKLKVGKGSDSTCGSTEELALTDTCRDLPMQDRPSFARLETPALTCPPTNASTKRGVTDGRSCVANTETADGGTTCTGTSRCQRRTAGFTRCIQRPGVFECPPGFGQRNRAGVTADDTRECEGCSCTTTACNGQLEIWAHPNCMAGADSTISSATHAACSPTNSVANAKTYKARMTGGCQQATPSVATLDSGLTITGEQTICCP